MPTRRDRSSFGIASAIATFTTLTLIFAVPPVVPPSPGLFGVGDRHRRGAANENPGPE
jgi:hypothetical protein